MRMSLSLAVFALAGMEALAQGGRERVIDEAELRQRAAKVLVLTAPDYPKPLVEAGVQGTVDVHGVVRADGSFDVSRIEPSHPELRKLVEEVTAFWLLRPSYGPDCEARPVPAQVRLWFEIKDGKGVISMSQPAATKKSDPAKPPPGHIRKLEGDSPRYPRDVLNRGIQGDVEALLRITPAGVVASVTVLPGPVSKAFEREVERTLRDWRFEPRPLDAPPICYFVEIWFRIV